MADRLIKRLHIINEFYFFRLIFTISELFNISFFYIFLYTQTNSLSEVISFQIVMYLGLMIGFVLGSFLIEEFGYIGNYKLSFLILGINQIFLAFTIGYFNNLIIVFAMVGGFARGLFWSTANMNKIKEFGTTLRNLLISNIISVTLLMNIIIPPIVGAYLSFTKDYAFIFLIGGLMLISSVFIPWQYTKNPKSKITKNEFITILRNKYFINYGATLILKHGFEAQIALIFFILPFILIGDEFGVGILATIVAIFSVFLSITYRGAKETQIIKLGIIGNAIEAVASTILLIFWGVPGLVIRGLGTTLSSAMKLSSEDKIESKLREIILKDKLNQSIIELNFLAEIFMFLGRFSFLLLFLIFSIFIEDIQQVFKIIILLASIWGLMYIPLLSGISSKIRKAYNEA